MLKPVTLLASLCLLSLGCADTGASDSGAAKCDGDVNEPDLCDGVDSDCDGEIDEDATALDWYPDEDGDSFGQSQEPVRACEAPSGFVDNMLDCDDTDDAISPDAQEICGGVDEDCDGLSDDDDPSVSGLSSFYLDEDGDGFGSGPGFRFCDMPDGYADNNVDCDDGDDAVLNTLTWYADEDGDGYGDAGSVAEACDQPSGYVADTTDCDDGASGVNPGASEVCLDELDNDCDGTDNGCVPLDGHETISSADVVLTGTASYFGALIRSADTDGDGQRELLSSAPYNSSYAGTVYLFEGLEPGDSGSESLATGQIFGSSSYSYLGYGMADGADYDGDGFDDLALMSASSGYVVVVDGPVSSADSVDRASMALAGLASIPSLSRNWMVGAALRGDGEASLLIGDPYYTGTYTYEGLIYVIDPSSVGREYKLGEAAVAEIYYGTEYTYLGLEQADLGDLDGDGVHEVGVGCYACSYVYSSGGLSGVFTGELSGMVSFTSADLLVYGGAASQYSGNDIIGAGDVDGDGYGDLALSAYYDTRFTGSSVGAAYVVLGPPPTGAVSTARADVSFYGSSTSSRFALRMATADLNGDGAGDLAMADYTETSYAGGAYLYYGPMDSGSYADSEADAYLVGSSSSSYLGYDIGGVGDLDLDGYEELAVSVYGSLKEVVFFGGSY